MRILFRRFLTRVFLFILLAIVFSSLPAVGSAEQLQGLRIEHSSSTTFFSDQDSTISLTVSSPIQFKGQVNLRLVSVGHTLGVFREEVVLSGGDAKKIIKINFRTPALKPNVIEPVDIQMSYLRRGKKTPVVAAPIRMWIFPKNLFGDKEKWLSSLGLILYDISGRTARMFQDLSIPVKITKNWGYIYSFSDGIVIVGENVSLNGEMATQLINLAARGLRVICLNPKKFTLTFSPEKLNFANSPVSLYLSGPEVIKNLNKSVDSQLWSYDGVKETNGILLKGVAGGSIKVKLDKRGGAWPWIKLYFPKTRGSLTLFTLSLVDFYERNPTPEYLLYNLFKLYQKEEPVK